MSRFELILACIRSGQMSEQQVSEELKDPAFKAYYNQRIERV